MNTTNVIEQNIVTTPSEVASVELGDNSMRQPVQISEFDAFKISKDQSIEKWQLDSIFEQKFSGALCLDVIDEEEQKHLLRLWNDHSESLNEKSYTGGASNISAIGGPSHWEPSYANKNSPSSWLAYFEEADNWRISRKKIFEEAGYDPIELLLAPFKAAYGHSNVKLASHPKFGRSFNDCVIRKGQAKKHVDNANWDIGVDIIGHIGVVIVLAAGERTVQRVHRYRPTTSIRNGKKLGNYGLEVPENTEYIDIPSPAGSYNLVAPSYVHELLGSSVDRITIATHIVKTRSGEILFYA